MTSAEIRTIEGVSILDYRPAESDMRADVLEGLADPVQKRTPSKYLYDARGSKLFDEITELPEYYPTRTELALFDEYSEEIAEFAGSNAMVIELGSGSELKIGKLLGMLDRPAAYAPVEISRSHLLSAAKALAEQFPEVEMLPVCADFTAPFSVPEPEGDYQGRLIFFPGSTIGNFAPEQATKLLKSIASLLRPENPADGAVLGIDLVKDTEELIDAYDDSAGVTAAFTLNILRRLNRELDANFDLDDFEHEARYRNDPPRIEMHAVAKRNTEVTVAGERFRFEPGESIHTENSHKFTVEGFSDLAERCGLRIDTRWIAQGNRFAVLGLRLAD